MEVAAPVHQLPAHPVEPIYTQAEVSSPAVLHMLILLFMRHGVWTAVQTNPASLRTLHSVHCVIEFTHRKTWRAESC